MTADDDAPRSLGDEGVRERRRGLLNRPHFRPLAVYAAKLRRRSSAEVPEFDPLDGGIEARFLFLFEKPGPMTSLGGKRKGSGFISRDNDDPTAEATFRFMRQAGIPRRLTVIWNVIPWWNGTRKITSEEWHDGVKTVQDLIGLLPNLRAVIMVGRQAAKTRPYLADTHLALFTSDHPSPMVRARWLNRWKAIPSEWAKARRFIDDHESTISR